MNNTLYCICIIAVLWTCGESVSTGERFKRFLFGSKTTTTRAPDYKAVKSLVNPGKNTGSRYFDFENSDNKPDDKKPSGGEKSTLHKAFDPNPSQHDNYDRQREFGGHGIPSGRPDSRYRIPIHQITTTQKPNRFIATKRIQIGEMPAKKTYCKPGICGNHGRCVELPYSEKYLCMCNEGHVGTNCERSLYDRTGLETFGSRTERKKDYCNPNPCMNGASCISMTSTYLCECRSGFGGLKCERRSY